jgi:hypothetical protein
MMSDRHDHHPVLPGEAKSLPQHVERCAERYMALVRYHNETSRRIRRLQVESRFYTAVNAGALAMLGWFLYRLLEKVS